MHMALIIGIGVWFVADVLLALNMRRINKSEKKRGHKALLYGVNVLMAIVVIFIGLNT